MRCAGETDINPVGPMGKIIQLVFAFVAPGNVVTDLMAAAVACGGAGQAGDLMHDFKAGMMMRLSQKTTRRAARGRTRGNAGAVPAYALFRDAAPLGGEQPAPAAARGRAVAEVLRRRRRAAEDYPRRRGRSRRFRRRRRWRFVWRNARGRGTTMEMDRYLPSPTSLSIAFIIAEFSAVGGGCRAGGWWAAKYPAHHEDHANVAASGLLAGAGVTGVITAMISMARG